MALRPIGPEPISLIVRTDHPLTRSVAPDLAVVPYSLVRCRDEELSPSATVFLRLIENKLDND